MSVYVIYTVYENIKVGNCIENSFDKYLTCYQIFNEVDKKEAKGKLY